MSRVGARHGQAIFKLVRTGGVDSKGGLKGQLNYIFRDDKVAEVIDPSGIVKAHDEPTQPTDQQTCDQSVRQLVGEDTKRANVPYDP